MFVAFGMAGVGILPAWFVPELAEYRPWKPGTTLPVVRVLMPTDRARVVEDDRDGLVEAPHESGSTAAVDAASAAAGQADAGLGELLAAASAAAKARPVPPVSLGASSGNPGLVPSETPTQLDPPVVVTGGPPGANPDTPKLIAPPAPTSGIPNTTSVVPDSSAVGTATAGPPSQSQLPTSSQPLPGLNTLASSLPARAPGVATPLIDPEFRGMSAFYRALSAKSGITRAAHYGDSTIAADGITGTVRRRLQARFGNGGPGYINAGIDPRWNSRPDLTTNRSGDWTTKSILLGGAGGKYGYGGVVATAADGGYLVVHAPKLKDGTQMPMTHLELWHQTWEGSGGWWLSANGADVAASTANAPVGDAVQRYDIDGGYTKLAFGASGGPVSFYGVVMETAGPGVVWDALGVIGVGTKSFNNQSPAHLERMVAQRKPDLIVVMLGGNELGYPIVSKGDGSEYGAMYRKTLDVIRAGAPNASCLVLTPLDQGTREDGEPRSKPALPKMVRAQARVAIDAGCAFWNSWSAMGGDGSIIRWSERKNPLAWTDLLHLSGAGQDIIGQLLSDAIEADYDQWVARGGQ